MSSPKFVLLLLLAMLNSAHTRAEDGARARVDQGRRLLAENNCNGGCHKSHAEDNDPLTLYARPNRRVKDLAGLRAQVDRCVANLGLPVFPEESAAMVAALDFDFYKFK